MYEIPDLVAPLHNTKIIYGCKKDFENAEDDMKKDCVVCYSINQDQSFDNVWEPVKNFGWHGVILGT